MDEEFKPINTQADFDVAVMARYGDVAGLKGQIDALTGERDTLKKTNADLTGEIKGYKIAEMKSRIAREKGIPAEMAARLSGETEKDISADADSVAAMIRTLKGPAPLAEPGEGTGGKNANLTNMLHELRGE